MFCRWEDLREAVKEAKDLTQGGEEYLACSAKVISAIEFIRNNYARQICLEDIAEYAGVSRVYLSQIFKKETGKKYQRLSGGISAGKSEGASSQQ